MKICTDLFVDYISGRDMKCLSHSTEIFSPLRVPLQVPVHESSALFYQFSPRLLHESPRKHCVPLSLDLPPQSFESGSQQLKRPLSWADQIEEEEEQKRKDKADRTERFKRRKTQHKAAFDAGLCKPRKLFIGKIRFERADAKSGNAVKALAKARTRVMTQIFSYFGHVDKVVVQNHWKSEFCFVIYSERSNAKSAIRYLSIPRVRKSIIDKLRTPDTMPGSLPLSSFYVRWPSNNSKKQNNLSSTSTPNHELSSNSSRSGTSTPFSIDSVSIDSASVGSDSISTLDSMDDVVSSDADQIETDWDDFEEEEPGEEEIDDLLRRLDLEGALETYM